MEAVEKPDETIPGVRFFSSSLSLPFQKLQIREGFIVQMRRSGYSNRDQLIEFYLCFEFRCLLEIKL